MSGQMPWSAASEGKWNDMSVWYVLSSQVLHGFTILVYFQELKDSLSAKLSLLRVIDTSDTIIWWVSRLRRSSNQTNFLLASANICWHLLSGKLLPVHGVQKAPKVSKIILQLISTNETSNAHDTSLGISGWIPEGCKSSASDKEEIPLENGWKMECNLLE